MQAAELFNFASEWLFENVPSLVSALVIVVIGWTVAGFISRTIKKHLPDTHAIDNTIAPVLAQVSRYGILIVAFMLALGQLGVQTNSMLAVLGAAGLAIALGLQSILSNIAAGLMIIGLRPMSVGDYIEGDGAAGTVTEIGLFGTRLRSANGIYLFVPNSQIWGAAISNYSLESRRRLDIRIGIAYDADIKIAREALLKVANSDTRVLSDPQAVVHVDSLGDSAITILLRVWVPTVDYWSTRFDFNEQTKLALDAVNIEIPYNKLDVNLISTPTPTTPAETNT